MEKFFETLKLCKGRSKLLYIIVNSYMTDIFRDGQNIDKLSDFYLEIMKHFIEGIEEIDSENVDTLAAQAKQQLGILEQLQDQVERCRIKLNKVQDKINNEIDDEVSLSNSGIYHIISNSDDKKLSVIDEIDKKFDEKLGDW